MDVRSAAVVLGNGLTVLLLVAVIASYLAEPFIAFSVFVGIPVGILAGLIALWLTYYALERGVSEAIGRALAAVASFGYAILLLYLIRVFVPITRRTLLPNRILWLSILVTIGVYLLLWRRPDMTP